MKLGKTLTSIIFSLFFFLCEHILPIWFQIFLSPNPFLSMLWFFFLFVLFHDFNFLFGFLFCLYLVFWLLQSYCFATQNRVLPIESSEMLFFSCLEGQRTHRCWFSRQLNLPNEPRANPLPLTTLSHTLLCDTTFKSNFK